MGMGRPPLDCWQRPGAYHYRGTPTQNTDSGSDWAKWNMDDYDLNLPANAAADGWVDDDAPALLYTVTQARLRAATHLRVDTRVDNGGRWAKGTPAAIPPS